MLILTGNNLGERHRDLNAKVTEAVDNKTNFDEVKSQEDKCDVDKLFKIELASRYKNIDYILEILKTGDVFHITRALKCSWIYNEEYSNYINVTYLENNVFPNMSTKMKKKMLTSISINLRNSERAIDFYKYCKEAKMTEYAFKFLVYTTDKFKLFIMKDERNFDSFKESKYLKQFIGNSIVLARTYMGLHHFSNSVIHALRYLYFVNEQEYLNNLEEFNAISTRYPHRSERFGIRISRDILKKYKRKVIKRPVVYITQLNINMLIRYLSSDDVKSLAPDLLPPSSKNFWSLNFYKFYKFLFDKIPTKELFIYLKQIFNSKYPGESFEMYIEFYKLGYYEMLTTDEQEEWALLHIERDKDLPGIENFTWYKFVSFSKAFSGIKRYIFFTPDEQKRSRIVNILPQTVRNQDDLAKMLDYYYQRHVNEKEVQKERFINEIIKYHDIYSLNNECWTLLDKLFHSLDVYSTVPTVKQRYKEIATIYRILHQKELPEALQEYITYDRYPLAIYELSKERTTFIVNYLLKFHAGKLKSVTDQSYEDNLKYDNDSTKESQRSKPSQIDVKSIVDTYESHEELKPKYLKKTEGDYLRWLKQDTQMATEGISEIRSNARRWNFRLCRFLKKLKVYFPNDVGKDYLKYFIQYLSDVPKGSREYRNIKMAVVGVFYLADEDFKEKFMEKYVPKTPKINHKDTDIRVLQVQKAICRLVYHSRPSLPLSCILKYIVGDYAHYCLPMFNHYLANWICVKDLTKALLESSISIQEHGLHLAFKCYNPETLKLLTVDFWKNTANVSVRKLLYKTIFKRVLKQKANCQNELYQVLKLYTADLIHYDDDEIYSLLVFEDLPYQIKGDFVETAWLAVSKLSDEPLDLTRKTSVIKHIDCNIIYYVRRQFIRLQIIDDHIHDMLYLKNILKDYDTDEFEELIEAKWSLTIKYIVTFYHGEHCDNKVEQQRSLELLHTIMTKFMELWNHIDEDTYSIRTFIHDFIKMIIEKDPLTGDRCGHMVPIYRCILDVLQQSLKKEETYLISWELKLHMACRNIIHGPYTSVSEACNKFGNKVGRLIRGLVEKGEFHHCFYQSMASIVNDVGVIICDYYVEAYNYYYYYVSDGLTDIKINETYIIAIITFPTHPYCNGGERHADAIRKIRKYDSREVRSFLYKKFVASDYKVRRYFYE